jgi:CHASE2 domain-containing sensor protein
LLTVNILSVWLLEIYLAGVAVGLVATHGGVATRIGLALLWPLGPLAFIVVSAGLLLIAGVAFPMFGIILTVVIAGIWWMTFGR